MDRSVSADPLLGRLLDGRYLVGERIARGGMATVYEATDLRLDRLVALKIMAPVLADDGDFAQRFVREARAAARLTHPNVVAVYDQGDDNGTLFLAMEYVPGRRTLRDLIREQAPLPPSHALALLDAMLTGIAAAHESGIVHRDIKPENVLLGPRGEVKAADFGLARAISAATSATATGGVLMGTVSYLPPELVTAGTADARSDVYALGVLLYELLTGEKPHQGDNPIQVAYRHVHDDVPTPSAVVPGLPPYVDALVARATSRQPEVRPADAHVMLRQLRRVRHAVDNFVVDDPELTRELTPIHRAAVAGEQPALALAGAEHALAFTGAASRAAVPGVRSNQRAGSAGGGFGAGADLRRSDDGAVSATGSGGGAVTSPTDGPAPGSAGGYVAGQSKRRRRRRGGPLALLLVLLLAGGAGAAGWYLGIARYTTTPDVVSLGQNAARAKVERLGLTFQITASAYSEHVPDGRVIHTNPGPGQRILKDGTVSAVVSKGPERHAVPDLTGVRQHRAIALLRADHLTAAPARLVWSGRVPRGTVISVRPKAGTELRRDAPVRLVVSKGPQPIKVHNYTGSTGRTAKHALSAAGLTVHVTRRYDDAVAKPDVIRQDPASGVLHRGDPVRLVVSRGPHLVTVPDVLHAGTSAATAMLRQAGFQVTVQHYQPYFGLAIVVGQSVSGGSRAPYGSTITLTVI